MRGTASTALSMLYWASVLLWGVFYFLPNSITRMDTEPVIVNWQIIGLLLLFTGICVLFVRKVRELLQNMRERKRIKEVADYEKSANIPPRS